MNLVVGTLKGVLVSIAITSVISLVEKLIPKAKDINEEADKAITNIRDIHNELENMTSTVDDCAESYAKLAQGIDQVNGKNKTLSTEKYKEFLKLSNDLAEVFPELVRYYDENGNAILNLSGDVDSIVSSLNDLVKVQQDLANKNIADNLPSLFEKMNTDNKSLEKNLSKYKEYKRAYEDLMNDDFFMDNVDNIQSFKDGTSQISFNFGEEIADSYDEVYDKLYKIFEDAKIDVGAILEQANYHEDSDSYTYEFTAHLNSLDLDDFDSSVDNARNYFEKQFGSVNNDIQKYANEIQQSYASISTSMVSYLDSVWDYSILDKDSKNYIQEMINNIQWRDVDVTSFDEAKKYISDNILQLFDDDTLSKELKAKFLNAFTQGTLSDNDYIQMVQQLQADIVSYFNEKDIDIPIDLNFLISDEKEVQERFGNRLSELVQNQGEHYMVQDFVSKNSIDTSEEREFFMNVTSDANNATEAIEMYYEALSQPQIYDAIDLTDMYDSLDEIQSAYSTVSNAIDEYTNNQCLSLDTVTSLLQLDDKYLSFLYDENGQLDLCTESYNALTKAKLDEMQVSICINALNTFQSITDEDTATQYLKDSTIDLTQAKWDDVQATLAQARADLQLRKDNGETVDKQLEALDKLESSTQSKINLITQATEDMTNHTKYFYLDSTSSANTFKQEIDWVSQSVSNLNNEISSLNEALNSEQSYTNRIKILEQIYKKEESLKKLQKDSVEVYKNAYKSALDEIGTDANKYKSLIESNENLSIEAFGGEGNKELYDKITSAQDAWEKYQQALIDYKKAVNDAAQAQKEIFTEGQSKINSRIEMRNNTKQDIQNKIDIASATNSEVPEDYYNQLMSRNSKNLEDYNTELQNALKYRENIRKQYGKESAAYIDADNIVQDLQNNIADTTKEQIELNKTIMSLPVSTLENAKDALEQDLKSIQKEKEVVTSAINAASGLVQNQIDYYTELDKATTDTFDNQINDLNNQKDALQSVNDEIKQQVALEKAKYNLDKAMNQKTVKVFNGKEFVYEADYETVRDAKETLREEEINSKVFDLDKQIQNLEDAKKNSTETITKQIESLQSYKDEIDGIFDAFSDILGLQDLTTTFGTDIIQRVLSGDLTAVQEMQEKYTSVESDEYETNQKISTISDSIDSINYLIEAWDGAESTIATTKEKIQGVLQNNTTEIKSVEERSEVAKNLAIDWSNTEKNLKIALNLINTDHSAAAAEENGILQDRISHLKTFSETASMYLGYIQDTLKGIESSKSELDSLSLSVNTTSNNASIDTMGKSHSGMELGYIGDTSSDNQDTFKYIALNELKDDEVARVLQKSEAVLTPTQIDNVMNNMRSALTYNPTIYPLKQQSTSIPSIVMSGDIVLQGVQDTSTLAKKIKNEFLLKLDQELYK